MFIPSINPNVNRKRQLVEEKSVFVAYPESYDSVEARLNGLENRSPFFESLARGVREKIEENKVKDEERRRRMFPKKDSPFVR